MDSSAIDRSLIFFQYANIPWLPWQCHQPYYLPNVFQRQVAEVGALRVQDSGLDKQETGKAVRGEGSIKEPTALSEGMETWGSEAAHNIKQGP